MNPFLITLDDKGSRESHRYDSGCELSKFAICKCRAFAKGGEENNLQRTKFFTLFQNSLNYFYNLVKIPPSLALKVDDWCAKFIYIVTVRHGTLPSST